ncbi:mitochondrial 2-oxodicarboxylate carrier, putative [Pediculus humanus corporis]|uniref:Mitochondrial 2-oxodicarboxylate carrier n=1 Tax=Pediculus humanus subsp. corporis TaxID=121224 RepID=E0VR46_PEDHC|nr:mitochondrial 2-oxodicarboxylate carrier, putative [Pediculus humanus corporis]EEB15852.1 mitochondrial 2-oxodicarboxylate carrier, putative [Pediculus humanus corporis]
MEKPRSKFIDGALQIISGGSAGFIEVCFMHPLDLIKTRIQIQSNKTSIILPNGNDSKYRYNGIIDCLIKISKYEGISSFYKGILPPLMAETPKRAIKFFTFQQYKNLFLFGSENPTPLTYSLAGACSGITEAVFVNPFEVVKIYLQSNKSKSKEVPSAWHVTKEIYKSNGFGLNGLNKGLSGTIARNGIFNMVYFGFYHSVKDILPKNNGKIENFLAHLLIGFTSGSLASCVNIPFDVAKSRIQAPQNDGKYKKLIPTMQIIAREEGWRALYKGLLPKIMRLGPGGAIMLIIYDYSYEFLKNFLNVMQQ